MALCHDAAGGAHVIRRLPVASLRGVVRAVGVDPFPRFDNGGGVQGAAFGGGHTSIAMQSLYSSMFISAL